jgi:hypothetical protein
MRRARKEANHGRIRINTHRERGIYRRDAEKRKDGSGNTRNNEIAGTQIEDEEEDEDDFILTHDQAENILP